MDRRRFALGAGAVLLAAGAAARGRASPAEAVLRTELAGIEAAGGGRLGAYVFDTGRARGFGWRQRERFGMCSTFKLSLAACILREAEAGRLRLDEVLPYTRADLLPNSPVTTANLTAGGMSVAALAEAAQLTSDNAAANLLLRRIGGPGKITALWRALGDARSRLDRYETALNHVPPGEVRDTVVPEGIARSVGRLLTGTALGPASRVRLAGWMARTGTGTRRIRAALPPGWSGGDKTGTAMSDDIATKINDIAVLYPPRGRAPLVVAAFYEAPPPFNQLRAADEAILQAVGDVAVKWVS